MALFRHAVGRVARAMAVVAIAAVGAIGCRFDQAGVDFTGDGGTQVQGDAGDSSGDGGAPLATGDMRLLYGEVAIDRVKSKHWERSSRLWDDDAPLPKAGGTPLWLIEQVTPAGEEVLAAEIKTVGGHALAAYRGGDGGWTEDWRRTTTLSADSKRGFDLAVEASGDVLAVYGNDSPTPSYRVLSGGQWSEEQKVPLDDGPGPMPDTNTGAVNWVELVPRPGGDEIALLYADSNRDLVGIIWDGNQWMEETAKVLETELKRSAVTQDVANRAFDGAFESQRGNLIVAWGRDGWASALTTRWSRATKTWLDNPDYQSGIVNGTPHYVDLAADPASDRVAAAFYDLGDGTERLGLAMWDGSQWMDKGELDSQTHDVNDQAIGDMPGQVTWIGQSHIALCIYADDQEGTLDWATWQTGRGWALENDVALPGKGYTESVAIGGGPSADRLVVLMSDQNLRLWATTYAAGQWQISNGGQPLSTVVSAGDAVPFSIAEKP